MPSNAFRITIHMVASLDGIIAKKDNSVAWFDTTCTYDKGVEITKQDMEAFLKSIDCYVMGARTYEHALSLSASYGWAYGDAPVVVLTHRNLPVNKPNIWLYSGSLDKLVNEQLKPVYKNVWVAGGAALAKEFINLKLADEIRLTIIPILLGEGKLLFEGIEQEQILQLRDAKAYKNGLVELCYEIKK